MSTSQGVNVLRYSALLFGVFYGFSHQRSIFASQKTAQAEHEYKHKESIIQKAKREYAKKHVPQQSQTADGGVITDPMDKNFDLEAYLNLVSAESA